MKKITFVVTAVCALAFGGSAFAGEILVNPGFESGSLTPWVDGSTWSVTSSGCHTGNFCATAGGNAPLAQTFAGVDVSTVTDISFWLQHPLGGALPAAYDLFYAGGGDDQFVVSTSDASWTFFDVFAQLRASGTLTGIDVWGYSTDGGPSLTNLDDLSVSANAATPEPASMGLLLAGLGASFGLMRRRS